MKNLLKMFTVNACLFMMLAITATETKAQWYGTPAEMWNNPTQAQADRAAKDGPCRDAWITIAVWRRFNRYPAGYGDTGECDKMMYNGGNWSSMSILVDAVADYKNSMQQQNAAFKLAKFSPTDARVVLVDTSKSSSDPGYIIALGGANIIANGGNNIIANGGGNLVGLNGSSLISKDGAGFQTASANSFSIQSGAKKIIKLGKSVIIVK